MSKGNARSAVGAKGTKNTRIAMNLPAASRIQSAAATKAANGAVKKGSFAARAQSAAAKKSSK